MTGRNLPERGTWALRAPAAAGRRAGADPGRETGLDATAGSARRPRRAQCAVR